MSEELNAQLPQLKDCEDLQGKTVLLRAGLNEPIKDGKIASDYRIKKALATIKHLHDMGARTIVIAHLSRAGSDVADTLKPVCDLMNTFIPVTWANGLLGDDIKTQVEEMKDGDVLMLENLRIHKGEKTNDKDLAKELAAYADVYVNDAFSVSHREHASVVGIPEHLPSYAGLLFMDEIQNLSLAREPEQPSLFVLGGAKFETKMPLVELFINEYHHVFIGGALANNFFKAKGYNIGKSLVSDIDLKDSSLIDHPKVLLPIDVVAVSDRGMALKHPTEIEDDEKILDAGPETIDMLHEQIRFAKTILWNGPLGDYEQGYVEHTRKFAEAVAKMNGKSIVGGGDTVASIEALNVKDAFSFISTAGGAMLIFLEKGTLPGIEALLKHSK